MYSRSSLSLSMYWTQTLEQVGKSERNCSKTGRVKVRDLRAAAILSTCIHASVSHLSLFNLATIALSDWSSTSLGRSRTNSVTGGEDDEDDEEEDDEEDEEDEDDASILRGKKKKRKELITTFV